MHGVKVLRPSRLLAVALVAALVPAALLADRAMRRARAVVEADAEREARESATLAGAALRAEIAAIERDAAAGAAHPGADSWRVAAPPAPRLSVRAGDPGRTRAELIVATASRELTGSGLPVAAVSALALGEPEVMASVLERLLAGELPVNPDDLPRLAELLGAGDDPRVPALARRLRSIPPVSSIPRAPEFLRRSEDGGLQGWSRTGDAVVHWSAASTHELLERLGVHARPSSSTESVTVPGVPGLALHAAVDRAPAARLGRQRALLAGAFATLGALGVAACWLLARDERALSRERAFLASITHELRTPVTAVRLLGETLAEGRGEPREYGRLIASEAERLESLVEKSLLSARTEARLQPAQVSMFELLERAVRLAEPLARRKGKRLRLAPGELPCATWDGEAVRQAVSNLIDNALRHGGPNVVVRASAEGDVARVAISDDGPGIVRRDRRRVFERFVRGSSATGGTGLGLWLVEQVARAHGGRVELVTEEGAGCTFELVLPLHAGAPR